MNVPRCEFCLTKILNRKIEPGCVFCMTLWEDVRPDDKCFDCDSNKDFTEQQGEETAAE